MGSGTPESDEMALSTLKVDEDAMTTLALVESIRFFTTLLLIPGPPPTTF